jgi:alkylhydroperoxidase/carboxymuconolactone decarboxylase family protein YurZ
MDLQLSPEERWLSEVSPAYGARRKRLLTQVFAPEAPTFPVTLRYALAGVVAASRGSNLTTTFFQRALEAGADAELIVETILVAERPGGTTMLQAALEAISSLVQSGRARLAPPTPAAHADDSEPADGSLLDHRRGYAFKAFDLLEEHDPEYNAARRGLTSWVYDPSGSQLTARDREIIAGSVLCSRSYPSAKHHFERALREGASVRAIIEALEAAAIPGGGPTMHFGLEILTEIQSSA